jgi:hypothetical protein
LDEITGGSGTGGDGIGGGETDVTVAERIPSVSAGLGGADGIAIGTECCDVDNGIEVVDVGGVVIDVDEE